MTEKEPWVGEGYWVSPLNYAEQVTQSFKVPQKVQFHDVTLRDGEQTPGVVFRKDEKVAIARALDEIGVDRIEAGMPVVSAEDREAVKEIARAGLKAKVFGFGRLLKEDIDASLTCDVGGIICEGPVGVPKLRQFNWSIEDVTKKAIEAVDYAKAHGLYVVFFGVDTTRADLKFLLHILKKVTKEAKADAVAVVDTFGCTTPEGFAFLVRRVRETVSVPIEVHCHSDFGLGTACTIAGLLAGAQVAHTSVNGIGERTGNASFEEVSLALRLLYGIPTNLKFESFCKLSQLISKYSGMQVPSNKPIVGERAFTRESGISIAGWMKYHLGSESYLPELVGNKHGVLLGKKSGRHSVEWKLNELGLKVAEDKMDSLLARIKELSEAKKGPISDEEFLTLQKDRLKNLSWHKVRKEPKPPTLRR